jgi:hypothetical protein
MSQNSNINNSTPNPLNLQLIKITLGWIIFIGGLIHQLYIIYKINLNDYFETTISHLYYFVSTTWIPLIVGSILLKDSKSIKEKS